MDVLKTIDHIQIKIPASSKAPNQDLKAMGVDHIHINIKMPDPSQEPPASLKGPNDNLKDMDVLYTFKIKLES